MPEGTGPGQVAEATKDEDRNQSSKLLLLLLLLLLEDPKVRRTTKDAARE